MGHAIGYGTVPLTRQRLIHGGVYRGEWATWTLCEPDHAQKFDKRGDTPFILMIDRGDCTFAKKVSLRRVDLFSSRDLWSGCVR